MANHQLTKKQIRHSKNLTTDLPDQLNIQIKSARNLKEKSSNQAKIKLNGNSTAVDSIRNDTSNRSLRGIISNPVRNKFLSGANKVKTAKINQIIKPLWLSVSEAAKLGGVNNKTIRRAIKYNFVKFKILGNRYLIDFASIISYLHTKTKLKNKFYQFGLGQYINRQEEKTNKK